MCINNCTSNFLGRNDSLQHVWRRYIFFHCYRTLKTSGTKESKLTQHFRRDRTTNAPCPWADESLRNLSLLSANASRCSRSRSAPVTSATSAAKARKATVFQVAHYSEAVFNSPGELSSWQLEPPSISAVAVNITKLAFMSYLSHVTWLDQSNTTQHPKLAPTCFMLIQSDPIISNPVISNNTIHRTIF